MVNFGHWTPPLDAPTTIVIVKFEVDRLKIGQEKLRVKLDIS